MKFAKLVDARKAIWERLLASLKHDLDLGVLYDFDCEDEADEKLMEKAIDQVKASLQRRVRNGDIR